MRLRVGLALLLSACTEAPAPAVAPKPAPAPAPAPPAGAPPRLIAAPAGGRVAEVVAAESGEGVLIVYVGASWCEPCVAFHDALTAGDCWRLLVPSGALCELGLLNVRRRRRTHPGRCWSRRSSVKHRGPTLCW